MERGREKFNKYKSIITFVCVIYSLFPKKLLKKLLIKHRKQTGILGLVIRYALLKNLAQSIGDNVSIHPDVYLFNVQSLSIGNNVSIHPLSYIEAYGGVKIGDDVSIAHGVTIMAATHEFTDRNTPIKDQGIIGLPIIIGDNVWIGAKASILGGNTISSGTVIGASSVITKDIEKNCIVAGVPARKIKER